jgi:hypothetical protein
MISTDAKGGRRAGPLPIGSRTNLVNMKNNLSRAKNRLFHFSLHFLRFEMLDVGHII